MTRAHAPDCGAFFAGRCDCAVGALEEMVAYATKADERIAELTAEPAARTRDAALARCEREEKERKEANARVVRLQEALATTVKGRDEANARADAAEQRAVAALAQVEHFRRRLDAEAMRANEAAERARDATNLLGKCLEEIRKHEREYHHETAPDLLAQVEHYLMELHR